MLEARKSKLKGPMSGEDLYAVEEGGRVREQEKARERELNPVLQVTFCPRNSSAPRTNTGPVVSKCPSLLHWD